MYIYIYVHVSVYMAIFLRTQAIARDQHFEHLTLLVIIMNAIWISHTPLVMKQGGRSPHGFISVVAA